MEKTFTVCRRNNQFLGLSQVIFEFRSSEQSFFFFKSGKFQTRSCIHVVPGQSCTVRVKLAWHEDILCLSVSKWLLLHSLHRAENYLGISSNLFMSSWWLLRMFECPFSVQVGFCAGITHEKLTAMLISLCEHSSVGWEVWRSYQNGAWEQSCVFIF